MSFLRLFLRGWIISVAATLAACAQHGAMLPSTGLGPNLLPDAGPPACKGQKNTQNYASLTVKLSTIGGAFCIPAYAGFGGSVKYPSAKPAVKLTFVSSTKNYNHQPHLGKGTAIFYLQLALSGATSFGTKGTAGGGLTAAAIVPGKPYTAYGQAVLFSVPFNFGPCYTIAIKGKYGGVIGAVGTLLKGQNIPGAAKGVIEFYAGKQTGMKC